MKFTQNQLKSIHTLCEKYQVSQLYVFGSFVDDSKFCKSSDIDLLVRFRDDEVTGSFDRFMGLLFDLKLLMKREIDLVSYDSIKNPFFKQEVDETKQEIFSLDAA